MMRRIGLVGFFGWGNFGDELMLRGWREALSGVEAEPVNTLLRRPYFERPAEDVATEHDALLIGGGDLLHPDAISALYWNRAWLSRPVVISGVGVALERDRERSDVIERLRRFFGHSSIRSITARDEGSAAWIRDRLAPEVEVEVIPDLGFAARLPAMPAPREDVMRVVLRKVPTEADTVRVQRIQRWADATGLRTELLVLAIGSEAANEVEALRTCGVDLPIRTEETLDGLLTAIGSCRLLVTAKFHGAVIASRFGVPSLSLRATHKVAALAGMLDYPQLNLRTGTVRESDLDRALCSYPPSGSVQRAERDAEEAIHRVVTRILAP